MKKATRSRIILHTRNSAAVNGCKPSVDVLFKSAADALKDRTVAVLLTGMGNDGAKGLLHMKENGARTIAQDEDSCVVFGMPKEAIENGAAEKVVPLDDVARTMINLAQQ